MYHQRRNFLKQGASLMAASSLGLTACQPQKSSSPSTPPTAQSTDSLPWPITEGPNTPKMCYWIGRNADPATLRNYKQIGVDHAAMGGPPIPWTEQELQSIMDRYSDQDMKVMLMMIGGFPQYDLRTRGEGTRRLTRSGNPSKLQVR